MAGDVTFRTQQDTPVSEPVSTKSGTDQQVSTTTVEVPYLDYAREHGKPFSVEFFGLGSSWKDPTGGFPKEIGAIEDYFRGQIESGEVANSVTAVKERMKEILKLTNMGKEERAVLKIETIAAYIKFLMEKEDIKRSVKRYGNTE